MVHTYFNEELTDVCFEVDALDEWKQLNEELGLNLQNDFISEAKSPIPYPWMNTSMTRIFEALCPEKVDVTKYNKTPIPLEVLKTLKYCKEEGFFHSYEIWYDDKTPDPCLIGKIAQYYCYPKNSSVQVKDEKGNIIYFNSMEEMQAYCIANSIELGNSYETNEKSYLIARWADVVRPLNELEELARERIMEKYGAELKNLLSQTQTALQKLTENVILFLSGEISASQLKGQRW